MLTRSVDRSTAVRYAIVAAMIFMVQAASFLAPRRSLLLSDLCVTAAAGLAVCAISHRALKEAGQIRIQWILFAIGLMFWFVGQVGMTIYDQHQAEPQPYALGFDFALFFFGMPILFALASSRDGVEVGLPFVLNGLQITVAAFLIYLQIHPEIGGGNEKRVLSPLTMMYAYNTEHILLTLLAGLRLLARPQGQARSFFQTVFAFVLLYTGLSLGLNYAEYIVRVPNGTPLDLLWSLPFLAIAPASFYIGSTRKREMADESESALNPSLTSKASRLAHFLIASAPMFVTIALLLLGGSVARDRFALGMSCIALATLSYGFNSSLLQSRYLASEQSLLISQSELLRANQHLERLSFLDGLTGVANRRGFDKVLEQEWTRALRQRGALSLLIIDIDHFKRLNDTYGHPHGDLCLIVIADALRKCLNRSSDLIARYGGEEFVTLLPGTDSAGARAIADQMLSTARRLEIDHAPSGQSTRLTISIGLATQVPTQEGAPHELISLADAALYQAKRSGRDCIVLAAAEPDGPAAEIETYSVVAPLRHP